MTVLVRQVLYADGGRMALNYVRRPLSKEPVIAALHALALCQVVKPALIC